VTTPSETSLDDGTTSCTSETNNNANNAKTRNIDPKQVVPGGNSVFSPILSDWWAWKWSLLLLKSASISAGQEMIPFNVVHAAARLVGCPLPILALAVSTFPNQVTGRDPTRHIYNVRKAVAVPRKKDGMCLVLGVVVLLCCCWPHHTYHFCFFLACLCFSVMLFFCCC
jgi:hypothetical protein